MQQTVTQSTTRKLILVRQLFKRALAQAEVAHSYVDRIISVMLFDAATETLLKVVIHDLPTKPPKLEPKFHKYIEAVNTILENNQLSPLADVDKIRWVHEIRNTAQHQARHPNENELNDCRTYTRDFLQRLVLDVWGLDFEAISLIDLIRGERIKELLHKAVHHLGEGDFVQSIAHTIMARDSAKNKIRPLIVGDSAVPSMRKAPREVEDVLKGIRTDSVAIRNHLVYIIVGMDYKSYWKYISITKGIRVSVAYAGNHHVTLHNRSSKSISKKDATFAVEFITNLSLQMEDLVGSLQDPFDISEMISSSTT